MKTYLNGFLGAGCVIGVLVATLLFSKIGALEGRIAALEASSAITAVGAAAASANQPSSANAAAEAWGSTASPSAQNPFGSLGGATASEPSTEELLKNVPPGFDIQDPRFQQKLADMVDQKQRQRHEERREVARERWHDDMRQAVSDFTGDMGLQEFEGDIVRILDDVDVQRQDLFQMMKEDGMSQSEGRREMQALHSDMEDDLRDMLGDEDFQSLMRSVPMGPRPPRK